MTGPHELVAFVGAVVVGTLVAYGLYVATGPTKYDECFLCGARMAETDFNHDCDPETLRLKNVERRLRGEVPLLPVRNTRMYR